MYRLTVYLTIIGCFSQIALAETRAVCHRASSSQQKLEPIEVQLEDLERHLSHGDVIPGTEGYYLDCNLAVDDRDLDKISDKKDNCPKDQNTTQLDSNGDGIGDICEKQLSKSWFRTMIDFMKSLWKS